MTDPAKTDAITDPAIDACDIVSSRLLAVPRERVFRAFSDAEQLARWWGPEGFTNTFHEHDFRAGGAWRFTMHAPDGNDYESHSVFVEVREPERIVFKHCSPRTCSR